MKVTFNIRSRNLICVTPENSDPLKYHSVWNIFVSFVETTQKIDKSQTDNLTLTYLAPLKSCFGSIGKNLESDFRLRKLPFGLVYKKNSCDFRSTWETKLDIWSRKDVIQISPPFSKSSLNCAHFDTKFIGVCNNLLSDSWQGCLWSLPYFSLFPALS